MKNISFLYSTTQKTPKIAFLAHDGTLATIDDQMGDEQTVGSEKALNAIADTKIEHIIWWWPSGNAFREIHGISEFGIINIFADFGFSHISGSTRLEHKQVTNATDIHKDYIEVILSVSDKKYQQLVSQYGELWC